MSNPTMISALTHLAIQFRDYCAEQNEPVDPVDIVFHFTDITVVGGIVTDYIQFSRRGGDAVEGEATLTYFETGEPEYEITFQGC